MSLDAPSHLSSNALKLMHAKSGAALGRQIANAAAATPSVRQAFPTRRVTRGWRVAMETFPWARSSSHSHDAMLMQLSEDSAANDAAASAHSGVSGIRGDNATMVPAANKIPMASSFAGSERQIKPSG